MSQGPILSFDSEFALRFHQGLSLEQNGIIQDVDAVAARRQGRRFLGAWLETQVNAPLGFWLDASEAPFSAHSSGPVALVSEGCLSSGKTVTSLFLGEEIPFTIGMATSEHRLSEALLAHAAAGFDAVCCPVGELDRPALQYFTEVGRELRLSPIWMVESERCLRLILETDAPYFGFVAGEENSRLPFAAADWAGLRAQLPRVARAICFYSAPDQDAHSFMVRLAQSQFDAYVDLTP